MSSRKMWKMAVGGVKFGRRCLLLLMASRVALMPSSCGMLVYRDETSAVTRKKVLGLRVVGWRGVVGNVWCSLGMRGGV